MEMPGIRSVKERFTKTFLDLFVLSILKKKAASGNEITKIIYDKSGVLLSSGTLYPCLYLLSKKQLAKRREDGKEKLYELTGNGKKYLAKNRVMLEKCIGRLA